MRANLTSVERRWRTIALNVKAPYKLRLSSLNAMTQLSDRFLCRLLKRCSGKGRGNLELTFRANQKLAEIRAEKFRRKLLEEMQGG